MRWCRPSRKQQSLLSAFAVSDRTEATPASWSRTDNNSVKTVDTTLVAGARSRPLHLQRCGSAHVGGRTSGGRTSLLTVDAVLVGSGGGGSLLRSLRSAEPGQEWRSVLDLSQLTWCEPVVLVGIACLAASEIRQGRHVQVLPPSNYNVANYLARMRLGEVLTDLGALHTLPQVTERDSSTLLELRAFGGSRGAEQLAGRVDREVRPVDETVASALWEGICETGQNVEQHSGQQYGYVAAQQYAANGRFLFAVGDAGHGLLATLSGSGATTASEAIQLALQPGYSETGDPARGAGLPSVLSCTHELAGGLELVSGNTWLRDHHSAGQHHRTSPLAFQGTLVQGEIRRQAALH